MKAVYADYPVDQNGNLENRLNKLNSLVLYNIVPEIISELQMYDSYLKRTFGKREIMDLPKNVSRAGRKTLPSVINH